MSVFSSRATVILVVVVGLALTLEPIAAAQSLPQIRSQLEQVRQQRESISQRLESTQTRLEELYTQTDELEREQQRLRSEIAQTDAEIAALTGRVSSRIRQTYIHGSSMDPVAIFLSSEDAAGALSRAETIRWLVAGDRTRVDDLGAVRTRNEAAHARLDASVDELDAATDEFEALTASLEADLAEMQSLETSLTEQERAELARIERERRERERQQRLEAERRAREAAAAQAEAQAEAETTEQPQASGAVVCPIASPYSFIDSWGFPRSGGRRHRGTDMMAPHGTAIYAITDGVWHHQRPGRSAGNWGVLRGSNGDNYWYMHLATHVASNGARVTAGQRIATNGSTGNATTPHLHFELHPGGGSAVNPYPLLRSVC